MPSELPINYLGVNLSSPVIVGACPLNMEPEMVRQFVDAGAGAIVLPSMLQEQIVHRQLMLTDPLGAIEQSGYQPQQDRFNGGANKYLKSIAFLKSKFSVPIIASLSGGLNGYWLDYAKEVEAAGADALEFYVQSALFDPNVTSDAIEARLCELIAELASGLSIPVSVKINQRYTNLASMARQLKNAGAKGLVLFTHLPDWDVCVDSKRWTIGWQLSPINSLSRILEGVVHVYSGQLQLSIAASGSVASSEDAIKALIAGADVVMVTSAIYREGPNAIRNIVDGIKRHLEMNHYPTLGEFFQARPKIEIRSGRALRLEYVEPLISTETYVDPTPIASNSCGDAYGHMKE